MTGNGTPRGPNGPARALGNLIEKIAGGLTDAALVELRAPSPIAGAPDVPLWVAITGNPWLGRTLSVVLQQFNATRALIRSQPPAARLYAEMGGAPDLEGEESRRARFMLILQDAAGPFGSLGNRIMEAARLHVTGPTPRRSAGTVAEWERARDKETGTDLL